MTTTVEVSDDNCHHKSLITVSKISSDLLSLNIESGCEHIKKAAASVGQNLNPSAVTGTFDHNIVYEKVAESMPGCVVCAVPCAIVKASWAELGMNLKKGAHIQFKKQTIVMQSWLDDRLRGIRTVGSLQCKNDDGAFYSLVTRISCQFLTR